MRSFASITPSTQWICCFNKIICLKMSSISSFTVIVMTVHYQTGFAQRNRFRLQGMCASVYHIAKRCNFALLRWIEVIIYRFSPSKFDLFRKVRAHRFGCVQVARTQVEINKMLTLLDCNISTKNVCLMTQISNRIFVPLLWLSPAMWSWFFLRNALPLELFFSHLNTVIRSVCTTNYYSPYMERETRWIPEEKKSIHFCSFTRFTHRTQWPRYLFK